jgi:hypothetical protein
MTLIEMIGPQRVIREDVSSGLPSVLAWPAEHSKFMQPVPALEPFPRHDDRGRRARCNQTGRKPELEPPVHRSCHAANAATNRCGAGGL